METTVEATPETNWLDTIEPEYETEPVPEPVAEPVEEPVAERPRDAEGKFVAQPPASLPDPVKAAEEPKVIPLAALLEERRKFQAELSERDRRLQELETRVNEKLTPPEPEPDFIEDPKAYIDAKVEKAVQAVKQIEQKTTEVSAEQQITQVLTHVGSIEAEFVKSTPDYYDALGHIRQARTEQLQEIYPNATREQITQQLRQEEINTAVTFLQQGKNPSEAIYRMASKVYGYQAKAAAPAVQRPVVPQAPVADPSHTLGSTGGAPTDEEAGEQNSDDTGDVLREALAARFGKR